MQTSGRSYLDEKQITFQHLKTYGKVNGNFLDFIRDYMGSGKETCIDDEGLCRFYKG
jgi:hypothetical protein